MGISFNLIPVNLKVPGAYVEIDNSNARQGVSIQPYKALMVGQRLSTGTKAAGTIDLVTSVSQAKNYYGEGSMLHRMAIKWFLNNKITPLYVFALDDNGAGTAATKTLTVTGTSTAAGNIYLYIGEDRIVVPVASGNAQNAIATAIEAAIDAEVASGNPLLVTAGVSTNVVTLTARHKGENGQHIKVSLNFQEGEALPAGVSIAVANAASGATNPTVTSLITAMGEEQYNLIVWPYVDATTYAALDTELTDRWGPIRQIEGFAIGCKRESVANLVTFGDGKNSAFFSYFGIENNMPSQPEEVASAVCGAIAVSAQADPGLPLVNMRLLGLLAAPKPDRFTLLERNTLLSDGISTNKVDSGGNVYIERIITLYQENSFGSADPSYMDLATLLILSYIRYDLVATWTSKFPRFKLADDGVRFSSGQPVMTPSVAKAELLAKFRQWESIGLVENFDQFAEDLIVERNSQDVNRLDVVLPPDVINGLIVSAFRLSFLL